MQLLTEGSTPSNPATKGNLDGFIIAVKIPFTAFKDPDDKPFFINEVIGAKHTAYVLDRATMKVLYKGDEKNAMAKLEALE